MAYDPYPGVPAPNTLADATKMRAQLDALFTPPHAKCSSLSVVAFPSSAYAVTFDTEDFDSNGMYSAGSPKRITIQTAGLYLIEGLLTMAAVVTDVGVALRLNGTDGSTSGEISSQSIKSGGADRASLCAPIRCSVADYLELSVYHSSTSNTMGARHLSATLLGA